MNYIPKLVVEGYGERWLTHYEQEYKLIPSCATNDHYLEFLFRYFPYDYSDSIKCRSSVNFNYQPTAKDMALMREARERCDYFQRRGSLYSSERDLNTYSGFFFSGFDKEKEKKRYYTALTRLRYNADLDTGMIPNLDGLYDKEPDRPDGSFRGFHTYTFGGMFWVDMEAKGDELFFWEWFLSAGRKKGRIEFYCEMDELRDWAIDFDDCFCVNYMEAVSIYAEIPHLTRIRLSPGVTLNRGGTEHKHLWHYSKVQSAPVIIRQEEDPVVYIADAYWIDEEGKEIRTLMVPFPVTLYVVIKDYIVGKHVDLEFEDEDEEGVKRASRSGAIDSDGIITLPNFKMELVTEKTQENGN